MTYDDLAAALAPVGLAVVMPGAPDKALPCISIEPTAISIQAGIRAAFESVDVAIRYPLSQNNVNQFEQLNASTYAAIGALLGSQFLIDPEIPLFGEADAGVPQFKYVIGVVFPGAHDVC